MDLRSGYPFWLLKNGLPATYPALDQDIKAEVVVIGAGITGALVTHALLARGVDVVVIDRRTVAWGSTSASTALLQYEIDTNLFELEAKVGQAAARRAYWLGVEAIDQIEEVVETVGAGDIFARRPSLYVARRRKDEKLLIQEFAARQAAGLDVRELAAEPLADEFGVCARRAIVSSVGAEVDPYCLTYAIFDHVARAGARIFDRTEITDIQAEGEGVQLQTKRASKVHAKQVVFATGYEAQTHLKQRAVDLNSSYALVTEPVPEAQRTPPRLLWEAARPYFYQRTTPDGRLLMGGADEPFRNPEARDRLIERKTQKLLETYADFYPDYPMPEAAFAWAGTFGETQDGLAYIGVSPDVPYGYFALGYGGNGITYSMIAARIIADLYTGIANPDAEIFRFGR
jgi:glycine/D-amino acid oxidase-like deaminating enzyme